MPVCTLSSAREKAFKPLPGPLMHRALDQRLKEQPAVQSGLHTAPVIHIS